LPHSAMQLITAFENSVIRMTLKLNIFRYK
jgi:hypothetical protein